MSSLRTQRFCGALGLGLGVGLLLATACSANKGAPGSAVRPGGTGAGTGAGGTGTGVGAGSGDGNTGNINTASGGTSGTDAGACQSMELDFTPKTPTVFVLVDRSGSMFEAPNPPWEPLKMGALQVIQELQNDVAFGWGAFTGQAGVKCPDFASVPPAKNNYDAINMVYGTMGATGYKSETPVGEALPLAAQALAQSPEDGNKYILFVTDGQPDFCDDGDENCPLDDVVYQLQKLNKTGINTIIFGLQNGNVPPQTLQAFANAGAGQPVAAPFTGTAMDVYYSCQSEAGWKADYAEAGVTGMSAVAAYAATGGMTKYYSPDVTDQDALTTQLRTVLAGVKSCLFDLSKFTIDLNGLDQASVLVQGQTVPLDSTNGWRMNSESQLELVGSACTNWQQPQNTKIDFNFPCDIVTVVR
ncbi:MAG TPA: VWA domain-containing protein [Polyangiaceae bacterium]|jgi:hypothetical protein